MKPWVFALLFITLFIGVFSCSSERKVLSEPKVELAENSLLAADIFNMHKVWPYVQLKKELPRLSTTFFLRGIDHLKNTRDTDSAVYLLRESILNFPSVKAYYELGNAYFEKRDFDQALKAYQMAERLGYEPFGTIMFQIAKIHSIKDKTDLSGQYLEYAIQAGFVNMDQINSDTSLQNLRKDTYTFTHHLSKALRGMNDADKLIWLQYKKSFQLMTLPLTLSQNYGHERLLTSGFIVYDYERFIPEMRDEKFSRETSEGFYYGGELEETDAYVALIYLTKNEFMPAEITPVSFTLATYTHSGKLIDKKDLAYFDIWAKNLTEARLAKNGSIEVSQFSVEFEKDPEEFGYEKNKVKSKTTENTEIYRISASGRITQEKTKLALSH